jgi:serine/threonine-protein kinase RsbW
MPVFSSTLDSEIELVEGAEESVRRFARETGFEEFDQYFIGLAVREILINAMKHGNHFERDKKVGLLLSGDGKDLTIEVTDQGDGFLLENVPEPQLPENVGNPSGRGLMIARGIMDEFSVDMDSPGVTCVRMMKRIPVRVG